MGKIEISSELMDFYAPLSSICFENDMGFLYSDDFFGMLSIGTDKKLYLYYAETDKSSQFQRVNITGNMQGGVAHFSAMQIADTGKFVIGVIAGTDIYFTVTGTPQSPEWIKTDFSKITEGRSYTPDTIHAIAFTDNAVLTADLKITSTGKVERFFVEFNSTSRGLTYYPCAANFEKIKTSVMGQAVSQYVSGIYTYGSYGGTQQILYTPEKNVFQPDIMPQPVRLVCDAKTDLICAAAFLPSHDNYPGTHLFMAGGGKLYFYPFEKQVDCVKYPDAQPVLIAESGYFSGIRQMFSYFRDSVLYVWVLNGNGQLAYVYADTENGHPLTWSEPLLLREDILCFGVVYDKIFFCEKKENAKIVTGEFDKNSGLWDYFGAFIDTGIQERQEPAKIPAFVTKIMAHDDAGNPAYDLQIRVKASEDTSAYVNGIYRKFRGDPMIFRTNAQGCVNIVQPVKSSLSAAEFEITAFNVTLSEKPSKHIQAKLLSMDSVEKINSAEITDIHGNKTPLITGVSQDDIKNAAAIIAKLNTVHANFYNPENVPDMFKPADSIGSVTDFFDYIEDAFNYLKEKIVKGFDIFFDASAKAWKFIIETGGKIISFIIHTVEQIYACILKIFEYIKAGIEKLIDWLKFIFNIDDVIEVKDVLKRFLKLALLETDSQLVNARNIADKEIANIIQKIKEWGDIDTPHLKPADQDEKYRPNTGNMYLFDMIFGNFNINIPVPQFAVSTSLENSINKCSDLYLQMASSIDSFVDSNGSAILDALRNIDITEIDTIVNALKKIVASAAVLGLELVQKMIEVLFDLLKNIISEVYDFLDTNIYIPFVSEVLKIFGINEFSILDVIAIVPAFFVTVVYKIATGKKLIDSYAYSHFMSAKTIYDLWFAEGDMASILPTGKNKDAVLTCKILLASISVIETLFQAGVYASYGAKEQPVFVSAISMGLSLLDFALSLVSGYVFYSPMEDVNEGLTIVTKVYTYCWMVKFGMFILCGIVAVVIAKKEEPKEKAECTGKLLNLAALAVSGAGFTIEVAAAVIAGLVNPNTKDGKVDKAIYLVEDCGYITDDIRNFIDCILSICEPESVSEKIILCRSLASGCYALSQVGSYTILYTA
jgi:hypothetical protein